MQAHNSQTQRCHAAQPEAEDRFEHADEDFPSMQMSSFNAHQQAEFAHWQEAQARERDCSFDQDHAYSFGGNQQQDAFKRNRSFSEELEGHDESFENQPDCFMQEEPEIELDFNFDDLNDFLAEVPKSVELIVIETPENADQAAQEEEENAIYAGERDSCCGESQNQHDNALDSTFQSWHNQQDLSYDDLAFEHSLEDLSLIDTTQMDLGRARAMSVEPQTVLINTCEPNVVADRYPFVAPVDLLGIPAEDPNLDFWGGPSQIFTGCHNAAADHPQMVGAANIISFAETVSSFDIVSDINLGRPVGAEVYEDVIMVATSGEKTDPKQASSMVPMASAAPSGSAGGVASKLKKRLADRPTNRQQITSAAVAAKTKKIAKTPKISAKQKLTVKKPATKKEPNMVTFCPHPTVEEGKNVEQTAPLTSRPKKGERNYYQNFDFFFKRTCFRTMSLYFKTAYKPFFDKWNNSTSKKRAPTILDSLIKFTDQEFPGLLPTLSEKAKFEFIELVKLLVLAHRHNKNDDFLADPLIDFSIVREPMYKYSKHAQDRFFDMATYAFLFSWFEASPQGKSFAMEKFAENAEASYPARMVSEVSQMGEEAFSSLQKLKTASAPAQQKSFMNSLASQKMAKQLESYLEVNKGRWGAATCSAVSSAKSTNSTMEGSI